MPPTALPLPQTLGSEPCPGHCHVRFDLVDDTVERELPAGAVGSIAVYTSEIKAAHIIRKVMMRMETFMNFIIPF